jgi:hypothetical protein
MVETSRTSVIEFTRVSLIEGRVIGWREPKHRT